MASPEVPAVDISEGRRRIDAGACPLDVREADEWDAGHVDEAVWIPMGELPTRQSELPDDRRIVVICRSGARSARVTTALIGAGYDAVNLAGGMKAWAAAGLDVVTDDGSPGIVT